MIITKIQGGLGNQMFQYAIAKAIAKKRNDIFKLDISIYSKKTKQTPRKYELNHFNIDEHIASDNEIRLLLGNENVWFKLKRKLGLNPKKPKAYFKEKDVTAYETDLFSIQDDLFLEGFWQNEDYFKDLREEILAEFTLKKAISQPAQCYLNRIKETESVSIHVRRGDYVQDAKTASVHGSCGLEYYQKSIKYFESQLLSPIFYVFSDDIDWCKDNFSFCKNIIFIDTTETAFDDLELMKSCQHNVIANSTFSWWGAWLNSNDNKIVIAPKIWWTEMPDKTLALESWVVL